MNKKGKKILSAVMGLSMVASIVPAGTIPMTVQAEETTAVEYEIYPTPHAMTYQEGSLKLPDNVNVVYDSDIDDATKNRLSEILDAHQITETSANAAKEGKTDILVGIYNSGDYVDDYVTDNYTVDTNVYTKFGGHVVIADEEDILVLGADTDAAFYGLTSLKHIFNQMENNTIRNFTITDYADTNIRGFIEGYYGIPWSNEDRMSLMKFGGDFKMTSYIFAPKDDPYHTTKWRELYPEEELKELEKLAQVGVNSKCRFVWTVHPFMARDFNANNVSGEITSILNKFEQLYSIGVRQFGVLGDDVGNLNRNVIIQVMNAVSNWAKEKGDVYDTVFCPGGYNDSWQGNYSELNEYDAGFPDDVQIFWTGQAVCKPIEQLTLNNFRRKNATNGDRRAPLFWLNWPVNDINGSRLMMGKGSLLHTDITISDLYGAVTNPMQEAEASKVALFALADYTWNVKAFDDDQSWVDSFKYIEPDAPEALHTLAKHMSNPEPNGHGLVLGESEELKPLIDEFKAALADEKTSLKESGEKLMAEMQKIIDAHVEFHAKSKNENLKEELLPFTGSLKDLAQAIKSYIASAIALELKNDSDAVEAFLEGNQAYADSKKHVRIGLNQNFNPSPGSTELIPLADALEEAITDKVTLIALGDISAIPVQLSASSSFDSFYNGTINNIIDGKDGTHAWYGDYERAGQYYQVDANRPVNVYGIRVLNGSAQEGKAQDTFQRAKLQYTQDGTTWKDVEGGATTSDYQVELVLDDIVLEDVLAVRYVCTQSPAVGKWPSMREFTLNLEDPNAFTPVYTNVDAYKEYAVTVEADTHSINPIGNITLNKENYIGVKLDRIHELKDIDYTLDGTYTGVEVQYSMNGQTWTTFDGEAEVNGENARYIRLYNPTDAALNFNIDSFVVTTNEIYPKSLSDHNYNIDTKGLEVFDGDWTTATHYKSSQQEGKYFIYDLGQEIDFNSLKVVCRDSEHDFPRHAKFSVSTDAQTWTTIMTLGNQEGDNEGEAQTQDNINDILTNHEISYNTEKVSDLNLKARYLKFEITRTKTGADKWIRFQELEINDGAYMPSELNPTYEGPEESFTSQYNRIDDKRLSTAYTPETENDEFIYHVSEEEAQNSVHVIQRGISNAEVSVRTTESKNEWIAIGTLTKAMATFSPGESTILDIKITWNKAIPNIVELYTSNEENPTPTEPVAPVVKTELEKVINEAKDLVETDYTADSWKAFSDALAKAKEVAADEKATQNDVDAAKDALVKAQKALVKAGDDVDTPIEEIFNDVRKGDWYYEEVEWVYKNGIMKGYDNVKAFGPADTLKRAQFAQIMYNLAGEPEVEFEDVLVDVRKDDWYAAPVIWAYNEKIITGYTDGSKKFGANDQITREQIATILYRYAKTPAVENKDALKDFPDADKVTDFAKDAMIWAVEKGIITGDNGNLNPGGKANRAETAAMMQRVIPVLETK